MFKYLKLVELKVPSKIICPPTQQRVGKVRRHQSWVTLKDWLEHDAWVFSLHLSQTQSRTTFKCRVIRPLKMN